MYNFLPPIIVIGVNVFFYIDVLSLYRIGVYVIPVIGPVFILDNITIILDVIMYK